MGLLLFLTVGVARADIVADLVRGHIEALGGRDRLMALKTMRATGHVDTGVRVQKFELLAQRPRSIRVTTIEEGRTLVQGCDGKVAWRQGPGNGAPPYRMEQMEAADFMAESEFDDQLVDPERRGLQLDYAGEETYQGRRAHKLLVTTMRLKPYFLLLDAETYFIVAQRATQQTTSGRTVVTETRYSDFAPLAGVLLPRRFTVYVEDTLQRETVLDTMEANPAIDPAVFAMPRSGGAR